MMDRSKTEWTWAVRSRWTTEPRRQAGIDGYWLGLPTQRGCPTIAAITSQFLAGDVTLIAGLVTAIGTCGWRGWTVLLHWSATPEAGSQPSFSALTF